MAEDKQVVLRGAMTAVVTPMLDSGALDLPSLGRIATWQVEQGIHGLVPCGTTGEGATLTEQEAQQTIATVVRAVDGRVPVVAGCGSNATAKTVEASRRAADVGADALLAVTPYYNKPNPSGMIAHYAAIAEATPLPIVVYNVPGRTGQNLGVELTLKLAEIPGVAAVKEASANLEQIGAILERRPRGFAVLSGDDALTLPTLALGADGVISVAANAVPQAMAALVAAGLEGDFETARRLHFRLLPLMRANFIETNPVPVKHAMAMLGHCGTTLRPPLGAPTESSLAAVREALRAAEAGELVR